VSRLSFLIVVYFARAVRKSHLEVPHVQNSNHGRFDDFFLLRLMMSGLSGSGGFNGWCLKTQESRRSGTGVRTCEVSKTTRAQVRLGNGGSTGSNDNCLKSTDLDLIVIFS
jgi:hypothetical protein